MPDRTVITPSRDAANRMAQDARDALGSALRKIYATGSGGLASMPPLTGSIMITGLPYFLAIS